MQGRPAAPIPARRERYHNPKNKDEEMAEVKIKGMRCQHCVASVTKALGEIEGVSNVKVDLEAGVATFDSDREIPDSEIAAAITAIGFEVA